MRTSLDILPLPTRAGDLAGPSLTISAARLAGSRATRRDHRVGLPRHGCPLGVILSTETPFPGRRRSPADHRECPGDRRWLRQTASPPGAGSRWPSRASSVGSRTHLSLALATADPAGGCTRHAASRWARRGLVLVVIGRGHHPALGRVPIRHDADRHAAAARPRDGRGVVPRRGDGVAGRRSRRRWLPTGAVRSARLRTTRPSSTRSSPRRRGGRHPGAPLPPVCGQRLMTPGRACPCRTPIEVRLIAERPRWPHASTATCSHQRPSCCWETATGWHGSLPWSASQRITREARYAGQVGCHPADIVMSNKALNREYVECTTGQQAAFRRIVEERPSLVIVAGYRKFKAANADASAWRPEPTGSIAGARDGPDARTPHVHRGPRRRHRRHARFGIGPAELRVGAPGRRARVRDAVRQGSRHRWTELEHQVADLGQADFVDPTSWVCPSSPCPAVIGKFRCSGLPAHGGPVCLCARQLARPALPIEAEPK